MKKWKKKFNIVTEWVPLISILDQLAQLLEYLLGDDVAELLHLFHDLGHFAQVVDPLVVGQLLPDSSVPLRQMEG